MNFIRPHWPAPLQIKAYTTVRTHWDKHYPSIEKENTDLVTLLQLPEEPLWITQMHSATVLEALAENQKKNADALFTRECNRVCAVLTADCLPILICNKRGTQVAAIHAGWRGLANGIVEATLNALREPPNELLIWLGPAIGPQKFEVGQDVYDAFMTQYTESKTAFSPFKKGKWLADLYALAKMRLKLQGISQVYGGDFCTYTQSDLFFSYRRDGKETGRMASVIWMDSKLSN